MTQQTTRMPCCVTSSCSSNSFSCATVTRNCFPIQPGSADVQELQNMPARYRAQFSQWRTARRSTPIPIPGLDQRCELRSAGNRSCLLPTGYDAAGTTMRGPRHERDELARVNPVCRAGEAAHSIRDVDSIVKCDRRDQFNDSIGRSMNSGIRRVEDQRPNHALHDSASVSWIPTTEHTGLQRRSSAVMQGLRIVGAQLRRSLSVTAERFPADRSSHR